MRTGTVLSMPYRPAGVLVTAIVSGALLIACNANRGCTPTRLILEDIEASQQSQLRVPVRLVTVDNEPVPNRIVTFSLLRNPDDLPIKFVGDHTDSEGAVTGDFAQYARVRPRAPQEITRARLLYVEYSNPDDLRDDIQPNYCSTDSTVNFRYTGAFG